MAFFARPDLSNEQFKQLSGSTLDLFGQTNIASVSGLTLMGDGGQIPIVVTGETDGYVLTYCAAKNQIGLALSSASGGSTIYNCASPTTCSVGGLNASTAIAGCNLAKIIEMMVAPVLPPSCSPNYATLSLSPSTSPLEIGCNIAFTSSASYNQGSVFPVYGAGPSVRTGLPTSYNYIDTIGTACIITSSSLSDNTAFASHTIHSGNNTVTLNVSYLDGNYPYKSDCTTGGMTCCPAGTSPTVSTTITGLLPYFWGTSVGLPVAGSALLIGANKIISDSSGDVVINYNTTSHYIWLAVPSTSPTKSKWYGSNAPTTNTEPIPGGLFNSPSTVSVNSPSSCWSSQNYKFYISNYQTSTVAGGTPYTITFTN